MAPMRAGVSLPCSWRKSGFTAATARRDLFVVGVGQQRHRAQPALADARRATPARMGSDSAATFGGRPGPRNRRAPSRRRRPLRHCVMPQILTRTAIGRRLSAEHAREIKQRPHEFVKTEFVKLAGSRQMQLFGDGAGGRGGVGGGGDGPADDEDVRAGRHGVPRGRHPALVGQIGPGRADARRGDQEVRARGLADQGDLLGAADDAVEPGGLGEPGQPLDLRLAADPSGPPASRTDWSRLVSTVTPSTRTLGSTEWAASTAARIIASPPEAWTLKMAAPRRASARAAPATVFGMSWNFTSAKTGTAEFDDLCDALRTLRGDEFETDFQTADIRPDGFRDRQRLAEIGRIESDEDRIGESQRAHKGRLRRSGTVLARVRLRRPKDSPQRHGDTEAKDLTRSTRWSRRGRSGYRAQSAQAFSAQFIKDCALTRAKAPRVHRVSSAATASNFLLGASVPLW